MKHIKKRFRQKKDAEFRTEAGIPRAWGHDRRRLVFAHVLLDVVVVFAETLEGGPVAGQGQFHGFHVSPPFPAGCAPGLVKWS